MAEKKKKQTAEFAKDENAFASGVSAKKNSVENKEKQKQSGAHQPRDADTTSGHNVQKFKQPESANGSVKQNVSKQKDRPDSAGVRDNRSGFQGETWKNTGQKAKSSQKKRRQQGKFRKENSLTGQKEKPDSNNADSKTESGFSKEQNAFTEDSGGGQTEETKESGDDYRRRDTYHQSEKRADTAGGNIRTGNARKHLISGVISRQRIMISQKKIPLQRVRSRSFMEAKN